MTVVEAEASDGVRSPVDVLRLVTAVVLVLVLVVVDWLFGDTLTGFATDLFAGLSAVPDWLVDVVVTGSRVLVMALFVAGAIAVVRGGNWRPVLPLAVAAGAAALLTFLLDVFDEADQGPAVSVAGGAFPTAAGLAAISAAVTAAAPWLPRGWRRLGWIMVFGLAIERFLATPASLESLAAVLIGWVAGAAAVVAFGGPWRRPRGHAVAAGLADVGVPLVRLEQASLDARGSTPYFGETVDGVRLFVKALGDDERSADRLFRLYRRILPRDLGDERPFSSLRRAVEHEALVALAARDMGRARRTWWRWPGPSPTGSSWPTRPWPVARSTAWPPTRCPTSSSPRCGSRWRACGPTGSPTGTCDWPTSSSPTTGWCG